MRLRRILSIILVILTLTMTVFSTACSSCFREETIEDFVETFESDGMFLYKKRSYQEEGREKYYYSLAGQESAEILPKKVYVPPYFNGGRVESFGVAWGKGGMFSSKECIYPILRDVESLYLSYNTNILSYNGISYTYEREEEQPIRPLYKGGPEKIFFIKNEIYEGRFEYWISVQSTYEYTKCFYVSNSIYDEIEYSYRNLYIEKTDHTFTFYDKTASVGPDFAVIVEHEFTVICANTTYHFNYEESPNEDIFFINDFERGGKIENTPYEPIREGYKFKGWYKEPECVNAWDFEKDTLPAPEYYENGELKYVETCLYAKWEKN